TSVDRLMRTVLGLMLRKTGIRAIPFVWFWPDGAPSCVVMTHDVEGPVGGSFCETLMDLDDSFGMKSAFQIVPEMRGHPTRSLVENVRKRGFEVNLHDLNHDGYLFHNRRQFLQRAAQITSTHARSSAVGSVQGQCTGNSSGSMPLSSPTTCPCRTWHTSSPSVEDAARSCRISSGSFSS